MVIAQEDTANAFLHQSYFLLRNIQQSHTHIEGLKRQIKTMTECIKQGDGEGAKKFYRVLAQRLDQWHTLIYEVENLAKSQGRSDVQEVCRGTRLHLSQSREHLGFLYNDLEKAEVPRHARSRAVALRREFNHFAYALSHQLRKVLLSVNAEKK
ncbi:MAG: hypothetical protein ACOCWQ_06320 [Nanoarchaeota archaeon]